MRQARLGPDHTDTIATMGELRYMLSAPKLVPTALKSESELNFLLSASKSIKYVDAEPACLEAVQLDPDNAAAQYSLGCVLANQAKYGEAVAAFREVVRLIPAFGGAHQDLAAARQTSESCR